MKSYLVAILSLCATLFIFAFALGGSDFKTGDCLVIDNEYIYKVLEVGKYGLRTIRPHYNEFDEFFITPFDLPKAKKMDCFNLFDKKGDRK